MHTPKLNVKPYVDGAAGAALMENQGLSGHLSGGWCLKAVGGSWAYILRQGTSFAERCHRALPFLC